MESVARSTQPGGNKARLVLDNVASPVVAAVEHKSQDRLKVRQALPFLQLNTGVRDEEGRRAHIRSVDLSFEGGTPNLVLDLEYEGQGERSEVPAYVPPPPPGIIGPSVPSIRTAETLPRLSLPTPRRKRKMRLDHTIPFGFPMQTELYKPPPFIMSTGWEELGANLEPTGPVEHRVMVEPELEHRLDQETTLLFKPTRGATPSKVPAEAIRSRRGGTFTQRARALASAFWSYFGDGSKPS